MKKPRKPKAKKKLAQPASEWSFSKRIREITITFDDLKTAMNAINDMSEEARSDYTARSLALLDAFGMLDGKGDEPGLKRVEKITAIKSRLDAMARLVDQGKIKKRWTMDSDQEGMTFISEDVLRVAAAAPLLGGGNELGYFDAEDFSRRLLEIAEQEGSA